MKPAGFYRKDGKTRPITKRISSNRDAGEENATRIKILVKRQHPKNFLMDYGDADPTEVIALQKKYDSLEKTLDNIHSREIKKIPTSFLHMVFHKFNKQMPIHSKINDIERELVRRGVYKGRTEDEIISDFWQTLTHEGRDILLQKAFAHFGLTQYPSVEGQYESYHPDNKGFIKRYLRHIGKIPLF